ncbi:MAG TPA: helix-turn-helix domain-containing protein [Steroidobacter sp.]|nr:helix-turn-helix domain-containing protein [Steroidobacter sp.]
MKISPKRRPGRPADANSADTRSRIIEAAVLCFGRSGFAETTNQAIARQAGVTSALLYHYFDSKAALYRAALHDVNAALIGAYRTACLEAPEASSMAQLSLGLEKVIELSRRRPGLMRFASASAAEIERNRDLEWLDERDANAFPDFFRELLQSARRRGELARGVDIETASKVLLACVAGLGALHGTLRSERQFAMVLRTFERMLKGDFLRGA